MAFNVNDFRGKLQRGGARNNLFEVILANPNGAAAGLNTEQLSFMCKSTQVPSSSTGTIDVPYFGRSIKVPGDREFQPWNITVINDETFDLRSAFERWQSAIASFSTAVNSQRTLGADSNPFSYTSTGTINQFGKDGTVIKTYTLVNVFPVEVGQMQLAWDANNQIQEFDVIFAFDYFTSDSNI